MRQLRQQQALWVWQNSVTYIPHSQRLVPFQGNGLVLERVRDTTCLQRVTLEDTLCLQSCCASCVRTLYSCPSEPHCTSKRMEEALVLLLSTAVLMIPSLVISHYSIAQKFPTIGNWNAIWKHLRVTTYLNNPNKSNTRGEFGLLQMLSKIFIVIMLSVIPFQFFWVKDQRREV